LEKLTSRRSPVAVHVKRLGADKSYREQNREYLCDGVKLLEEAVKSDTEIIDVLTASHIDFPLPLQTRVYHTSQDLINSLSPLKSAQDTLFTCKMPPTGGFMHSEGLYILLDGIQDPGNLGTILRTAEAFRAGSVLLTGNCADLYNPKTVRATMGAIFRCRAFIVDFPELEQLRNEGAAFAGAAPGPGHAGICDISLKNKIVAIGSEGNGLSSGVMSLCSELFTIPTAPECESLNAAIAAAIVMWEGAGAGSQQ